MVSFRGQTEFELCPGGSPLGVQFKFSDKLPQPFHMGVPPRAGIKKGQGSAGV